jgi:hypothetical protein
MCIWKRIGMGLKAVLTRTKNVSGRQRNGFHMCLNVPEKCEVHTGHGGGGQQLIAVPS